MAASDGGGEPGGGLGRLNKRTHFAGAGPVTSWGVLGEFGRLVWRFEQTNPFCGEGPVTGWGVFGADLGGWFGV